MTKDEKNHPASVSAVKADGESGKRTGKREISPDASSGEQTQVIEQFPSLSMFAVTVVNPVLQKITPDHISKTLEMRQEQDRADNKFRESNRNYVVLYVILAALLIVGATYWFSNDNPDLYKAILTHVAALAAGITGGWGWANIKRKLRKFIVPTDVAQCRSI